MKKILSLVLTFTLLLSVCSVAAQEGSGEDLPVIKKPVEITVTDDLGDPLPGVSVRLTDEDNNVVEAWQSDGGEHRLFLEAGEYSVDDIAVPEGYLSGNEFVPVSVVLTEEEQQTHVGQCEYDHAHSAICSNPNHVGIELYEINGQTAYCFNHGLANPDGSSEYIMQAATADFLYQHALNKKEGITAAELYDHVLGIMYSTDYIKTAYDLDDVEARYFTYIAIKSFTDPELECFKNFDNDGNNLIIRDANGKPVRDENGHYMYHEGGTVLGSVVAHALGEHKNDPTYVFPQKYRDAYNYLMNVTAHPESTLYIYYPTNWNAADGGGFQCLMTAQVVESTVVHVAVREATSLNVTVEWNDQNDKFHKRPGVEDFTAALELFADGSNVTDLYRSGMTAEDCGGTYVISFSSIPKRNDAKQEISYVLRASAFGYQASIDLACNGDTIVFTYNGFGFIPIDHGIVKPIRPVRPVKPAPRFAIGF